MIKATYTIFEKETAVVTVSSDPERKQIHIVPYPDDLTFIKQVVTLYNQQQLVDLINVLSDLEEGMFIWNSKP